MDEYSAWTIRLGRLPALLREESGSRSSHVRVRLPDRLPYPMLCFGYLPSRLMLTPCPYHPRSCAAAVKCRTRKCGLTKLASSGISAMCYSAVTCLSWPPAEINLSAPSTSKYNMQLCFLHALLATDWWPWTIAQPEPCGFSQVSSPPSS
jgi:hypothetical protein